MRKKLTVLDMEAALRQVGVYNGSLLSFHVIKTPIAIYIGRPGTRDYFGCVRVDGDSYSRFMNGIFSAEAILAETKTPSIFGTRIDYEYTIELNHYDAAVFAM